MGSFNSEYENYYSNLRKRNISKPGYRMKNNSTKKTDLSFIERRIITDLIGVLVLFCLIISCRLIVNPTTKAIYQYSKNIVSENYDYKGALSRIEGISVLSLKEEGLEIKQNVGNKISFFVSKLKMGN